MQNVRTGCKWWQANMQICTLWVHIGGELLYRVLLYKIPRDLHRTLWSLWDEVHNTDPELTLMGSWHSEQIQWLYEWTLEWGQLSWVSCFALGYQSLSILIRQLCLNGARELRMPVLYWARSCYKWADVQKLPWVSTENLISPPRIHQNLKWFRVDKASWWGSWISLKV